MVNARAQLNSYFTKHDIEGSACLVSKYSFFFKNRIQLKCGKAGSEKGQFANLELLDLSNTSITVLDLQNLTTLNTLDVRGSSIETMHVEGLESMDTLNLIDVKGEELKLDGWSGLVEINLSFSKWDKVDLKNCTGLKHLDLSNVTLTNLDLSELQDFESLEWIDLSNSTIEALIVRKTPFIQNINFFGSHIGKLHLEDLDLMKAVDLSFAEADEVHLIGWSGLETLNLSHCFVEHLSMVDTPDLKVLDLSHTSQRLLDQFNRTQLDNLASLNLSSCGLLDVEGSTTVSQNWKNLDLSHNYLNSLPHDFLMSSGASQLASLDVSHNFLKMISYGTVYPMIESGNSNWNLRMGNNLLNCSDCKNSWLTHGSNFEHVEDAICHNPSHLHGKAVADVEICENQ